MLRHYALDPAAPARDLQTCNQLASLFAFHKGRVVSRFPRDWWAMFLSEVGNREGLKENERKQIKNRMERCLKAAQVSSAAPYNGGRSWVSNAERELAKGQFAAVLSVQPRDIENWLIVPDDVDDDAACLKSAVDIPVPRTGKAMAAVAAPLMTCSNQVLFIDAHFDPYAERFLFALKTFLAAVAAAGRPPARLEYHLLVGQKLYLPGFRRGCEQKLPAIVPKGLVLTLFRWQEKEGSDQFHARYVLTERGGMRFDVGLDQGKPGQNTPVTLISPEMHERVWNSFHPDGGVYEHASKISVGSTGIVDDL